MQSSTYKRRKYYTEEINELVENNIQAAADVNVDFNKCMDATILQWMKNYDEITSGQPLTLYYALMSTVAHISIQSNVLQWNDIPRHLNIYGLIVGNSGIVR
ncbi:unnamed protein product [Rotaria sp. Silwood2]|nr:unnamed protein product [Rotaria sp. Silwood2]